ncbi:malto-oligosyltrehalose trehalohydrolase [Fulvivirgaceae bacterium PWU4]|uniref:Malto-oligosyltrehalose trehalohydrolase n=1 Tax=Chryseosolibacter histidini TaxID=2782349 RepID=A0AAP2GSP2_9BACT|nr:malto-oligosyltrehalose trehalohydrolase [Chryseosolibacter histidini]MBT1701425.1 malto-oligosyltrehalose trehalohydrolase [Chryseosolibacter histidini]
MNYQYPDVGAFCESNNAASFIVWAPERKHMDVVLGDKLFPMEKDHRGYWRKRLNDVPAGTPYLFRVDKEKTLPDPASMSQPQGVHGPSVVTDRSFRWTDLSWKGIALGDMVIYELHVGTFTAKGTFEGVVEKLPYLQALGVNAIELMPVAQFPGTRNWGYDGVYPFAVQHSYGGVTGLKRLVDEAHKQGIAIILDVVYNHLGPEGNYFAEYGPYFTDKYKTFWGSAINYDDAWCDGVRQYYFQNALMWLNDFHIDGLRLDAVHAIWDFSARHFIEELNAKVRALETHTGRKKVLIAEFDLNNPRYIRPPSKGGYGLDGQWIDEYHHALHALVTGETNGYYEDFGEASHLACSLRNSYVYTGQYSVHRKRNFGVVPLDTAYSQFVVFAQNHDQVGNRFLGDRLTAQLSFEALKLVAAVCLLSPHVPLLFMGEEYGEKNPFQYFISHTDKELVEQVRAGRKKEFAYFNLEGEAPDPQAEETFRKCVLSWNHEHDRDAALMLAYYQFLIDFRKTRKAMKAMERSSVIVLPAADEKVIWFEKRCGSDRLLIVFNFNKQNVTLINPVERAVRRIFDSASRQWNGTSEESSGTDKGKPFTIQAQSAVIFEF